MFFSTAFVIAALPFLSEALPAPVPRPKGFSIPLSKRDAARRADGSVDQAVLAASVLDSVEYVFPLLFGTNSALTVRTEKSIAASPPSS
jgi:hypothetical protein